MIELKVAVCLLWMCIGITGWSIGVISDCFLYKEKGILNPAIIIGGPFTLYMTLKSLGYGIYYAIKKKKHLRKYN